MTTRISMFSTDSYNIHEFIKNKYFEIGLDFPFNEKKI